MNARKMILTMAAGTLAAAAPAFADPPRWAPAHGYRHNAERVVVVKHRPVVREVVVREPVVVRRTVIVERTVYVERPLYFERPVYYAAPPAPPAPVYAGPDIRSRAGHAGRGHHRRRDR